MRKDLFKTINTEENYKLGLKSGMFWVYWPELTGNWSEDKNIILKKRNESNRCSSKIKL